MSISSYLTTSYYVLFAAYVVRFYYHRRVVSCRQQSRALILIDLMKTPRISTLTINSVANGRLSDSLVSFDVH